MREEGSPVSSRSPSTFFSILVPAERLWSFLLHVIKYDTRAIASLTNLQATLPFRRKQNMASPVDLTLSSDDDANDEQEQHNFTLRTEENKQQRRRAPPQALSAALYCTGWGLTKALPGGHVGSAPSMFRAVEFERLSLGHTARTAAIHKAGTTCADTPRLGNYPPLPAKNSIPVTLCDLARLAPGEFLNDAVVDYFISVLKDRLPNGSLFRDFCFGPTRSGMATATDPRIVAQCCPRGLGGAGGAALAGCAITAAPRRASATSRQMQAHHANPVTGRVHVFSSFFYTKSHSNRHIISINN